MTSLLMYSATSLVRAWTRLYTSRLPPDARDGRRAEIESDLWEFERDVIRDHAAAPAFHVFFRLVRGIPDDLGWWIEQAICAGVLRHQTLVVTGRFAGMAIVVGALWAIGHDTRGRAAAVFAP